MQFPVIVHYSYVNEGMLFSQPFQFLVMPYPLVQLCHHPVEEIGTAGILAQLDGGIVPVTLFGFDLRFSNEQ